MLTAVSGGHLVQDLISQCHLKTVVKTRPHRSIGTVSGCVAQSGRALVAGSDQKALKTHTAICNNGLAKTESVL